MQQLLADPYDQMSATGLPASPTLDAPIELQARLIGYVDDVEHASRDRVITNRFGRRQDDADSEAPVDLEL